jgi:hypothetical protein
MYCLYWNADKEGFKSILFSLIWFTTFYFQTFLVSIFIFILEFFKLEWLPKLLIEDSDILGEQRMRVLSTGRRLGDKLVSIIVSNCWYIFLLRMYTIFIIYNNFSLSIEYNTQLII